MQLSTCPPFSSVFLFSVSHIHTNKSSLERTHEPWPTYVVPPSSLLHNILKTPNRMKHENTGSDIAILEDVTPPYHPHTHTPPPFKGFKVEQKDTGWLTFLAVNHNEILSYSISTWINMVALVLFTLCVQCRLALGSGLCWRSSNGFVKISVEFKLCFRM